MNNLTQKELQRLSTPPGPIKRWVGSSRKNFYTPSQAAAFASMPVPYLLTLAAKKRLTTTEWLDLICTTLAPLGLALNIDCFRQHRDRSVHVAIYGLPQGKEASVTTTLWALCRSLGGRVGKRKSQAGRSTRFLIPGLSLVYAWSHDEISSGTTSSSAKQTPA